MLFYIFWIRLFIPQTFFIGEAILITTDCYPTREPAVWGAR